MNGRYLFQVNDRVRHHEDDVVGTITSLLTGDDVGPVEEIDPDNPCYRIDWMDGTDGFEYEGSLVPEYVNEKPSLFMTYCFHHKREVWNEVCSKIGVWSRDT
jgi:hypothetical protein